MRLPICVHAHAYIHNVVPGNMSFKHMYVIIDVKEEICLKNEKFCDCIDTHVCIVSKATGTNKGKKCVCQTRNI